MALTHTLMGLLLLALVSFLIVRPMLDFAQAIVYKRTSFIFPKAE